MSKAIKFTAVLIKPNSSKILLITPSPANKILMAKERRSSFIQNGITKAKTNKRAVFGVASFAM